MACVVGIDGVKAILQRDRQAAGSARHHGAGHRRERDRGHAAVVFQPVELPARATSIQ